MLNPALAGKPQRDDLKFRNFKEIYFDKRHTVALISGGPEEPPRFLTNERAYARTKCTAHLLEAHVPHAISAGTPADGQVDRDIASSPDSFKL